jgi:hypothetical protein
MTTCTRMNSKIRRLILCDFYLQRLSHVLRDLKRRQLVLSHQRKNTDICVRKKVHLYDKSCRGMEKSTGGASLLVRAQTWTETHVNSMNINFFIKYVQLAERNLNHGKNV